MASIRKRDGRPKPWEAVYRDPDGRQRTKAFPRKVDARRFLATVQADVLHGSYVDPQAGRVTFAEFADEWLAAQTFDGKTREGVESRLRAHLRPAFGSRELRAIKPSTVQAWLGSVSRELAPSTVRLLLATLSSILGAAVEDGMMHANPCRARSVKAPALARDRVVPWTVERVEAVVAAMPQRYAATAVVAAGCGLRQGEAFGLRVCDVDFLGQQVRVRQQVKHVRGEGVVLAPPKGGRTRDVPLPDSVAQAIAEHLRAFPAEGREALVLTNEAGGPINRGSYNDRVWKPALAAAGIIPKPEPGERYAPSREHGFHQLRHHYASVLLEAGVSIRALADYLGHADPGFTLRVYTHLMPASEDRARAAVDGAHAAREPHVSQEVR
jgi:integrase